MSIFETKTQQTFNDQKNQFVEFNGEKELSDLLSQTPSCVFKNRIKKNVKVLKKELSDLLTQAPCCIKKEMSDLLSQTPKVGQKYKLKKLSDLLSQAPKFK
jgi:hypothetical protein